MQKYNGSEGCDLVVWAKGVIRQGPIIIAYATRYSSIGKGGSGAGSYAASYSSIGKGG